MKHNRELGQSSEREASEHHKHHVCCITEDTDANVGHQTVTHFFHKKQIMLLKLSIIVVEFTSHVPLMNRLTTCQLISDQTVCS